MFCSFFYQLFSLYIYYDQCEEKNKILFPAFVGSGSHLGCFGTRQNSLFNTVKSLTHLDVEDDNDDQQLLLSFLCKHFCEHAFS